MHSYLTLQGEDNEPSDDGMVDEDSLCGSAQQDSDTDSTSSVFDIGKQD